MDSDWIGGDSAYSSLEEGRPGYHGHGIKPLIAIAFQPAVTGLCVISSQLSAPLSEHIIHWVERHDPKRRPQQQRRDPAEDEGLHGLRARAPRG